MARAIREFYGWVGTLKTRSRTYTTRQNIYQTRPNRPRSHVEPHGVPRYDYTNIEISERSHSAAVRARRLPVLFAVSNDAHEPHTVVRSSSSRCPEPPGSRSEAKDIAQTVLRRAQAADGQRTRASASCPGGCGAPAVAALASDCGPAVGST